MKIITSYSDKQRGWIRFFGKGGFKWKHISVDLLFSERNGYKKFITIGQWRIFILK